MAMRPLMRRKAKADIPERRGAPATGVKREALRKKLTSAAKAGGDVRSTVLSILTDTRNDAMELAEKQFKMGRLGGLEMARLIAALNDEILMALFDFVHMHVAPVESTEKAQQLSLCAVGGYGRGEMAPWSDLDLLFLHADKKISPHLESVTEYILYMLWDMGYKVGHAVRTIDQCVQLAKTDQTILTALLDLRHICGDEDLSRALYQKFKKETGRGKGRAYIAEKLNERDARHTREGNSRYVIEPNIKEGKGGLRDLHVLYWIARFLDKKDKINDPQRPDEYVEMGLFNDAAATRFFRAADFLWRARIHLHLIAGRPEEVLSFDKQTQICRKMGYAAGPIEEAVEKFMREYFTNAREVGALTRIACAKLEADNALRLPKGLVTLLPNTRKGLSNPGFLMDTGRLNFVDPLKLKEDPKLIMQLFEIAGRRNLDIHPNAFSAIDFRRNLIDNNFRRDPEISKIFQDILLRSKAPGATLKVMNESGVLGRYLLEFGGIVARTQFNMHHAYTVDEHTLGLVRYFHDLEKGKLEKENPLATQIVSGFNKSQRLVMYLTCLLHDTGKGQGDQCVEGAQLARRACRRLGISVDETNTISWLVRRHLDLSETAQRRDISDPATIEDFGGLMGSTKRLQLLYALTIVDIRAVGPGIWNDWKGVLLRDLYVATANYLEGKEGLEPLAKAAAAKEQLKERLPGNMGERITPILQDLGPAYWNNFEMLDLVRHASFFDDAVEAAEDIAVQTKRDRGRDVTELWVLTRDHPGLFANLSRAISSSGASIIGARLHTGANNRVMNVFYLQNAEGLAFGRENDRALATVRERALKAAAGDIKGMAIADAQPSRRAEAIPIRPKVRFLEAASGDATIIEVEGRDRPGLLWALANGLHEQNINVLSAHVEVVGNKAIDVFYVCARSGDGTISDSMRKLIKSEMKAALSPQSPANAA